MNDSVDSFDPEAKCPHNEIMYNVKLMGGLKAGKFTDIGKVKSIKTCIRYVQRSIHYILHIKQQFKPYGVHTSNSFIILTKIKALRFPTPPIGLDTNNVRSQYAYRTFTQVTSSHANLLGKKKLLR